MELGGKECRGGGVRDAGIAGASGETARLSVVPLGPAGFLLVITPNSAGPEVRLGGVSLQPVD